MDEFTRGKGRRAGRANRSIHDEGYFGAGYATTFYGDTDVLLFRSTGDGKSVVSGHPWDYVPVNKTPHTFVDLAFDVVVDEQAGEAWIVGASQGKHEEQKVEARGMLVRADLDTLDVLDPVIIAPKVGDMTQSMFYGGALDPAGLVVVGHECNWNCSLQRPTAYRYGAGGVGTVIYSGDATSVAFGSGIVRNAHGAVLIAVNVKVGPTMRGSLLGSLALEFAALSSWPVLVLVLVPELELSSPLVPCGMVVTGGSVVKLLDMLRSPHASVPARARRANERVRDIARAERKGQPGVQARQHEPLSGRGGCV